MSNASQIPFSPMGKSVLIIANTSAPTAVQAPVHDVFSAQNVGQYRVINAGTNTVYLGIGSTAAAAQANSVAPTVGTSTACVVLLPGTAEIIRLGVDTYFSGLASAATNVFIVPGQGI